METVRDREADPFGMGGIFRIWVAWLVLCEIVKILSVRYLTCAAERGKGSRPTHLASLFDQSTICVV